MITFSKDQNGTSLLSQLNEEEESVRSSAGVQDAIGRYRNMYKNPLFSQKTQEAYEKMLDDPYVKGNITAIQENIQWMQDTLGKVRTYRERFLSKIDSAVSKKWIGTESRERWVQRFDDPSVLEHERNEWLEKKFPKYLENWERLAEHHEKVMAIAKKKHIDFSKIDGLQMLANEKEFLNADYDVRKNLVEKAEAYLDAAPNKMEKGWKSVQSLLTGLTVGERACMHPSKVGTWMKRIFGICKTPEEVQEYLDEVLMPLVDSWKKASGKYDILHSIGIPPSFKAVSKDKFLKWHYDQRMSYLEELDLSQEAMEKAGTTALDDQKKEIRFDMSIEDYEEANDKLIPLLKKHPQDPDLLSMQRYIKLHWKQKEETKKKESKEAPDPQKHLDNINSLLAQAHPSLRERVYKPAMKKGAKTMRRTCQLLYNRVWVRQRGYTNDEDELAHATSELNKDKTRNYIEKGHTKQFERNVIEGDTANANAIREKCTSPQALYFSTENFAPVLEKIHTMKDDENYGYWTTAFLTDVAYDDQYHDVMQLQRPMLKELRALEAMGYSYTDSGDLTLKAEHKKGDPSLN